ncbi:hypothetical protein PIROE2DRAFT_20927 [Piromyces sp. E2]|nr:hypothetical protein PIROE2DRAFT_20927 [Piromyces sp. E2]|eukprot:OUM61579.1 hypothetical protein PIROE2DRAFT_20927 [Piromyces sp. E2]
MVLISYFVNNVSKTNVYPAVEPTETFDINYAFGFNSFNSIHSTATPTIGFVLPKNNKNEDIINRIKGNEVFQNSKIQFLNFEDQDKMNDYNNNYHNLLIAGIIFESDDYFHYTIRVNGTVAPDPSKEIMMNYALGRYRSEEYDGTDADLYMTVFSPIQAAVDESIIQENTHNDTIKMQHNVGKLGKAACLGRQSNNGGNLGYFISNIYMIPIIVIVINIVKEKEDGIKDGLLMAGTFANIQPILLFLSLIFYGLSCCSLAFIFSTFFKKNKTAGATVTVIIVAISCSNMISPYLTLTVRKIFSLFLCPITLGSLVYEIDDMENKFIDLTFKNLFQTPSGYFFIMLIFNSILYFFLTIIFDNLFSNEGSKYLSIFKRNTMLLSKDDETNYEQDIQEDFNERNGEKCIVEVSHVHKIFPRKKDKTTEKEIDKKNKNKRKTFLAVNDVNFKVYQNEIFAILGHNGAGKTTLINIMVGLLKASHGDVYFDGRSIVNNTNAIRRDFGVCAQYNTIFEQLTVEEHINFFSELKNIKVDMDEILRDIDLIHQKKMKAAKLSGGQKRKLCIGMALIGNPKYVFLDEPTTGLDPLSRRKIWELLLKKKEGRVIFLTTHYMDEADILADRKVIISKGKVRCLGTSLYLKNHFNMSYNLDIETDDKNRIHSIIQNYIPEATYDHLQNQSQTAKNTEDNKEIQCHTWKLPLNVTEKFMPLLNKLDQLMEEDSHSQGLVKKYALNMPTLEELFIHLEDHIYDSEDEDTSEAKNNQVIVNTNDVELPKLKEVPKPNNLKQILYLIKSRLKIFVSDKDFAFFAVFFPALINGVMFIITQKAFMGGSGPSQSNVISVPTMYNDTYFNVEPQSNLPFTTDDMMAALGPSGNKILTNHPLSNLTLPEVGDTYYLSSVGGQQTNDKYQFNIHYNDTMIHSLPATFNALSNAILASNNVKEKIVLTSHLYDTKSTDVKTMVGLSISGFMIGYCIVANINRFGPLVVRERELQLLKQLQLNGVPRINYWISCFITDIVLFLFSCILIFVVGLIVQYEPLMDIKVLIIILILMVIWSIPTMLYQYVISFFFDKEETAYSAMPAVNTFPVVFGYLIFIFIDMDYSIFNGIVQDSGIIGLVPNIYNIVLSTIFPCYGFIAMINSIFTMKLFDKMVHYDINFSHLVKFGNGISPIVLVLLISSVVHFYLIIHLDGKKNRTNKKDIYDVPSAILSRNLQTLEEGDDDVKKEYDYVKEHQFDLPLSVLHLSKEYKTKLPRDKEQKKEIMSRDPLHFNFGEIHRSMITGKYVKTAIMDVNFGVRNHECFGLLGPNGAGKSTTLNSITATMPQTTGNIRFHGIENHLAHLGELSMGYCPQNDILWKELTLREHLELFLRIRGYNSGEAKDYATQYIQALGLEEHQHKRADDLSGGTKRKLSLLIAICGYPQQIFLDEPSAGMDPSTRRLVWDTIKMTKNVNDSAIIMTTHSMEEAENLCDRLAILVNGRLSCIGSPEYLKMKFGDSYILELQSSDLKYFHEKIIEEGQLFENNDYIMEKSSVDRVKYKVKMTRHLGHIFEVMESCKKRGLVTDYSFNQTSLEQIFINFAKQQIINPE